MKKFVFQVLVFIVFVLIISEVVIRVFHLTIDIPQREIDSNKIQKYIPNQQGYWLNGTHQWNINSLGWPGEEPKSTENLITIIGDSHIENLMNPVECSQGAILAKLDGSHNYLQFGRSGASLLEFLEFAKDGRNKYKPALQLLYVKDTDFKESIRSLGAKPDVTQFDLKTGDVKFGTLKMPGLKKILYQIKVFYYLKDKIKLPTNIGRINTAAKPSTPKKEYFDESAEFMKWVVNNYQTNDLIFLFHPLTDKKFVEIVENVGIKTYTYKASNTAEWSSSAQDPVHWNCAGHQQAANEIIKFIINPLPKRE